MEERTISIVDVINILIFKWRYIVIATLLTTIISSIYSFFIISPIYSTNVKLFIGKNNLSSEKYYSDDISLYQNLAKTYAELISTDDLIIKSMKNNNIKPSSKEILNGLNVKNDNESQIISISYRDRNINDSKLIIDSITTEFINEITELSPNVGVKIIENSKYPLYPDNFKSIRNIVIGIISGFCIGILVILLGDYIKNSFNNKDQVEHEIGLPVLGIIPLREY